LSLGVSALFCSSALLISHNFFKPGNCPRDFQPFAQAKPCVHDGDCNDGEKCCVYEGTAVCAHAIMSKTQPDCPSPNGSVGTCALLCERDSDCGYNEKCCFNGCGYECMSTAPVKPGTCGPPLFTPWCYRFCDYDSQCPNSKKCCPTTCGRVCRDPRPVV
uniref:WAP four-disulfide core domain 2 n=1 Tax=Fundulus heteroclitus TaxID=8078 RepID=A0A3Q2QTH2_FUNHE